jgi:hypothetical protein
MHSYTCRPGVSGLRRPSDTYTIRSAVDGTGSATHRESRSRTTAARTSADDEASSAWPTLDDFGGRSDALGG